MLQAGISRFAICNLGLTDLDSTICDQAAICDGKPCRLQSEIGSHMALHLGTCVGSSLTWGHVAVLQL